MSKLSIKWCDSEWKCERRLEATVWILRMCDPKVVGCVQECDENGINCCPARL